MGLVSDGGVHSHESHLYALVRMALDLGSRDVRVHCFLDGRDTPPESGARYIDKLLAHFSGESDRVRVRTVSGRYYAMDRDQRWERIERAWRCLVLGETDAAGAEPVAAIEASYAAGVTDEFMVPTAIAREGEARSSIQDGDAVVFFNFRPDRARELTRAIVDPAFAGFERPRTPAVRFVCLTEYDPTIPAPVAFPKSLPCCTLADVLAQDGLRQLHIAETEKYAHVTFFLNGGAEAPKPGEERVLVSSPKVATYDLQPAMSAVEVTDQLVSAIAEARADVYIVNFANLDMVGHTGVFDATVLAVETVDACVGRVVDAIRERGGEAVDHRRPRKRRADARLRRHHPVHRPHHRQGRPRGGHRPVRPRARRRQPCRCRAHARAAHRHRQAGRVDWEQPAGGVGPARDEGPRGVLGLVLESPLAVEPPGRLPYTVGVAHLPVA